MHGVIRHAIVCLVLAFVGVGIVTAQQPVAGARRPAAVEALPALPAGAIRLVSYARYETLVAICAEEPGPAIEHGPRSWPRTSVWVHDGNAMRQIGTEPGTCDPAWSPDGKRVAVVAPGGLWVVSSDLRTTTHLVDARPTLEPANEFSRRTLSHPSWAPDASSLAFLVISGGTSWVEVVDARTGETVYSSDPEIYEFAWGPDSRSLHFGSRVVRLP